MKVYRLLLTTAVTISCVYCSWATASSTTSSSAISAAQVQPPSAEKKPVELTLHGDKRIDNYDWLHDSAWPSEVKDKAVLDHIQAENTYTESVLAPVKELEDTLYQEMKSRIVEEDSSYPTQEGDYFYYTRFEKGKDFTIHCRKKVGDDKEEVILDENELAQGQKNFSLGSLRVNPDHTLVAYSYDTSGKEIFTIQVKDLTTGKLLVDKVENTFSNPLEEYPPQIVWHNKLKGFFYVSQNKTQRSDRV